MRISKYGKKGHAVTSLVLSTTCQSTCARIVKQPKYLMSLCLCIFSTRGHCRVVMDTACACFIMGAVAISTAVQLLCCFKRTVWHMVETGNAVVSAPCAPACLLPWSYPRWLMAAKGGKSRSRLLPDRQERLRVVRTDKCMYQWQCMRDSQHRNGGVKISPLQFSLASFYRETDE
jgi:hypothetical protein